MILVTGATGFIGSAVISTAAARGTPVRGVSRQPYAGPKGAEVAVGPSLGPNSDWESVLSGVSIVVHTAARVHVMHDQAKNPLAEFRRINVAGTAKLARQAAAAGVQRFVFISSIKVNGEETATGRAFSAFDSPAPVDPYGVSKLEAEEVLAEIQRETGLEVVVIRPVLVYGPGVKGNFASMLRWLKRGVPLPFGGIQNRRSLVGLDNLVDLVLLCANHRTAPGHTFLVSDDEDLSTAELLRRTGTALGRPATLVPVPPKILTTTARLFGFRELATRLCGSLQVDIRATRDLLGWKPKVRIDEMLEKTARHYLEHNTQ